MAEERGEAAPAKEGAAKAAAPCSARQRNAVLFCAVALGWLGVDALTKALAEGAAPSAVALVPGVLDLQLVHNTGGAWGLFGDMTAALGAVSLAVCALILAYLFWLAPGSSAGEATGLALVFAGGVGNALDRFLRGYVVDFLDPAFVDFPVFNVADIGVTCGIAVFFAALAWQGARERKEGSA